MAKNRIEVKCINKSDRYDPYERIQNIGGYTDKSWKISLQVAINHIRSGEWEFFVKKNNHEVKLIIATSAAGNSYLKTENDKDTPDNLLSLPECP